MKRKQNHYTNEQQIIDKIDAKREQANQLNAQAEVLEKLAVEHFKAEETDAGRERKEESMKFRKKAKRLEEVVLPALGETLSEFQTTPMIPITGKDCSVASLV